MTRSTLYWILLILWALSLAGMQFVEKWPTWTNGVFFLALFVLLGWETYGPAVKGK
jgi:predicted membrane channel-forming protein YqfA (hemolysin III family)